MLCFKKLKCEVNSEGWDHDFVAAGGCVGYASELNVFERNFSVSELWSDVNIFY
jgi:hypothetical protein